MLKLEQVKLKPEQLEEQLLTKAAQLLRVPAGDILSLSVLRRAVDARQPLHLVYTLAVSVRGEKAVLRRCRDKNVTRYAPVAYALPAPVTTAPQLPPVVVGAGPAGLFAALTLANAGLRPILLERGQPVEQRQKDVEAFWSGGALLPESNVQFGEGGAGAFSDGKLNTGTKDPRHRFILEHLVSCGAPESILTDAKPHVGTDRLHITLIELRKRLLSLGADIRFGHRLEKLETEDGGLRAIVVSGPAGVNTLPARQLVLALGHSARDTVEQLYDQGLSMVAKPFAVGVRIEHLQREISARQYGPAWKQLPPSDYKLACHLPTGRSAFTFCVCPGGEVVAASSAQGQVVTNGMSFRARDGKNINGGFLVGVGPEDFPAGAGPLAGVRFQEEWERAAFQAGGGGFLAPAQRVEDFLKKRPSQGPGVIRPTYRPGVTWTELDRCLPRAVADTLRGALPLMDRKLRGFAAPDGVLTGVETRSSSPVRIPRGDDFQAAGLRGLYPCGEGAGYAGGIMSAAVDGIRCAGAIIGEYAPIQK